MTYHIDENRQKVFDDRYALKDSEGNPIETDVEQMWLRVASAIASVEDTDEKRAKYTQLFYSDLLYDFRFVPGGRILAGAGTGNEVTFYNCLVNPSPEDSYDGIFRSIFEMGDSMRRGFGVGLDLSTLRPKGAYVAGTGGFSSGPVDFAQIYSETTLATSQGGSRRGALMLMLKDHHPDIFDFVTEKQKPGRITGANVSVKAGDDFMRAVKDDADWVLQWNGKPFRTVKARELFDVLVESAWKSAEPGLYFYQRANKLSNLYYLPEYELIATNPCGEQPLNKRGVCNLGAVNLSKFVKDGVVLWDELERTVRLSMRFLDNVVDATNYFNEEQEKSQKAIRRTGLGSMGLADMLLKLKIRYGSDEAVKFTDELYKRISHWAYDESTWIAQEKGPFELFDADKFLDGEFIKRFDKKLRDDIRRRGIRNAFLLTQAPTGSTGLLAGVGGTGIEAIFAFAFRRTDRLGERIVKLGIADEIGIDPFDRTTWPEYVVISNDLTPKEHVDMQAAIQYWNDSAISKTANMPKGTTKEEVAELYMYAYDKGLKGITVYVDGSREGVIHHIEEEKPDEQPKTQKFPKRPRKLPATVYKQNTPLGKAYVTLAEDPSGQVAEIHIDLGAEGSDIAAIAKGLGITATLALNPRLQSLPHEKKVAWLVKQYGKIHGSTSHGFGPNRVNSLPHAIGKVLEEHEASSHVVSDESQAKLAEHGHSGVITADICPECGQATFIRQDGCTTCMNCGNSKCG